MSSGSAESYFNIVIAELKSLNIDITFCRGQAYDGTSVMSGNISGLQKRIKEIVPEATYVHCCAHNLNLVLVDSITTCTDEKLFFGTLKQIFVYISESFPRLKLFERTQTEHNQAEAEVADGVSYAPTRTTLKKVSTTRWASHKQ